MKADLEGGMKRMSTRDPMGGRLAALMLVVPALALAGCGSGDETAAPGQTDEAAVDETGAGDFAAAAFVELEERGGSGLTGGATLTPEEGVFVDVDVWRDDWDESFYGEGEDATTGDDEEPFGDASDDELTDEEELGFADDLRGLAVEIRRGSCDAPAETVHELGALEYGQVTAELDTSLDELVDGNHVLVVFADLEASADDPGAALQGDENGLLACAVLEATEGIVGDDDGLYAPPGDEDWDDDPADDLDPDG